jgi:sigma-B regulation protein RsbU (phosphoserine phosphatase)
LSIRETRTATQRSSERFELQPAVEATFGGSAVVIADLSMVGARIRHSSSLSSNGGGRLRFSFEETTVDLPASVMWSSSDGNGEVVSGISFQGAGPSLDSLMKALRTSLRCRRIEELREGERFLLRESIAGELRGPGSVEGAALEVRDLSLRGARVNSTTLLEPGSNGCLRFAVPRSALHVEVDVRVIWSQPAGNSFAAGLMVESRPEMLRVAIGELCESDLAELDPLASDLRLRVLMARARRMARFQEAIAASGIPAEDLYLIRAVDGELRAAAEEALYWEHRAIDEGGIPEGIKDSPHLVALWQFLGRSIDASAIVTALAVPSPASPGETLSEARDEIIRLRTLVEASKLINSSIEAESLFESILAVARRELDVERGTLYFVDEQAKTIWSKIASGLASSEIRLPIGKGLAGSVASTGETIILHDAYSDPRFDQSSDHRSGFHTRSMLCVPIRNREERIVGVLQLLNKKNGDFGTRDVEFLESLSDHMAIAMENATLHMAELAKNRMEREMQLGREIQSSLLARPPGDVARTELAADSHACYEVGGDYYDFIELPTGELGLAIGDVSGKGVSAALIMSSLQASLRMASPIESDLPRLVARLNGLLYRMTRGRKYVTFFFGRYDPATGLLRYVNAGHNPPIICHDGSVRRLESTGKPIGLLPDVEYQEGLTRLEPGDVLFLYTDGMNEACNPDDEEFGMERWTQLLADSAGHPAADLPAHLLGAIGAFENGAPVTDDKTVVVVRRR